MHSLKATAIIAALVLAGALFVPSAKSDQWNKKTILTVNEAIEIPGQVLEPGKYTMKLADSLSNRHIVQVFNEDETQIVTTILAIPNYRLQPTGKTEFGFWETPSGQPKALRSWFYPGDNFGQEFAYPKQKAVEIARVTKEPVPTVEGEGLKPAEVDRVEPQEERREEVARAAPPPPEPAPPQEAAPAPEPQREVTPPSAPAQPEPAAPAEELPQTASNIPLVALGGLLSLGAAFVLRAIQAAVTK